MTKKRHSANNNKRKLSLKKQLDVINPTLPPIKVILSHGVHPVDQLHINMPQKEENMLSLVHHSVFCLIHVRWSHRKETYYKKTKKQGDQRGGGVQLQTDNRKRR